MKIEEIINENYNYLSDIDTAIAKYVLDNKKEVGDMGINDLAKSSFSSKSSVLRFAQKLGFSGYSELKNYIKREEAISTEAFETNDLYDQVITDIKRTLEYLKNIDLTSIYEMIEKSQNIYVLTTGVAQENQAYEIQRLFLMIGKPIHVLPGTIHSSEYRRIMENVTAKDLIIVLSLSGENPNLDGLLDIPHVKGTKTISLTNFKSNRLAGRTDYNLYASSTVNATPEHWWIQAVSPFFIVIERLLFGYMDYKSRTNKER